MLIAVYSPVLVAALGFPRPFHNLMQRFERPFTALAQRKVLAIVIVGILAFVLNAGTTLRQRIPDPIVHDENSYLLGADTFLHGRLTNPTHPFWKHFESLHIIEQPTYSSKYPPGQALILALGKFIGGEFIVGAWLATGMACAAVCWMLYGYFPPKWALFGGLMCAFHSGIQMWGSNYWGGNLGVAGGAMVLGAVLHLIREPSCKSGAAFGLGTGILLYTRMYEGGIFALLLMVWIVFHLRAKPRDLTRAFALGLIALLPFIVFLGVYQAAVTGSPLKMPYAIHEADYGYAPLFVFQKLKPMPVYRHILIKNYHLVASYNDWAEQQSITGFVRVRSRKVGEMLRWLFRPLIFLVALFGIPAAVQASRLLRNLCGILAGFCCAQMLATWFYVHYAAPVVGLIFVLFTAGFRQLALWRVGTKPLGLHLVCAALILNLLTLLLLPPLNVLSAKGFLTNNLLRQGGKHLIFVRYNSDHSPHDEWVYNGADIDGSPIVWAREIDAVSDKRLREYFPGRKVWLALPDTDPASLVPYPSP